MSYQFNQLCPMVDEYKRLEMLLNIHSWPQPHKSSPYHSLARFLGESKSQ
jgi:hypothetical protein